MIPFVVFFSGNFFLIFLDLTGKPAALLKYKIQEDKGVPVSVEWIPSLQTHGILSLILPWPL